MALGAVWNSGQLRKVGDDIAGDFDGRIGRGLIPGLRYRRPPFITDASVIRWKGRVSDEELRSLVGRQVPGGDALRSLLRQSPLQRDRCFDRRRLLLVFLAILNALLA